MDNEPRASQIKPNRSRGRFLVVLGVLVMLLGASTPFWLVGGAVGGALIALSMTAGAKIIHSGRRSLARGALEIMGADRRAPVLYLRPFKDDGIAMKLKLMRSRLRMTFTGLFRVTYEQKLAHALRHAGPFVAIGNPREDRPQLGASRLYVADARWQSTVAELLSQAQLVILHAGYSDGLLWEVAEVLKQGRPDRLIISLPFDAKNGDDVEMALYRRFRENTQHLFSHPLPEPRAGAQFLFFDEDWRPTLLAPQRNSERAGIPPKQLAAREPLAVALDGLRREFMRVSTPYWLRLTMFVPGLFLAVFVGLFVVAGVINGIGSATSWAERTTLFGYFESSIEALESHRARIDQRRDDFRAIAATLPAPGTATLTALSEPLNPPPVFVTHDSSSNTEIVTVEMLLDPAAIETGPDIASSTPGALSQVMQWDSSGLPDPDGRASDYLREQLAASNAYRYVVVNRVLEYRAPAVLDAATFTFDPGVAVIEGFLVDLNTHAILAVYQARAESDHEIPIDDPNFPAAQLEERARDSLRINTRKEIGAALDAATHGALRLDYW